MRRHGEDPAAPATTTAPIVALLPTAALAPAQLAPWDERLEARDVHDKAAPVRIDDGAAEPLPVPHRRSEPGDGKVPRRDQDPPAPGPAALHDETAEDPADEPVRRAGAQVRRQVVSSYPRAMPRRQLDLEPAASGTDHPRRNGFVFRPRHHCLALERPSIHVRGTAEHGCGSMILIVVATPGGCARRSFEAARDACATITARERRGSPGVRSSSLVRRPPGGPAPRSAAETGVDSASDRACVTGCYS